MAVAAVQPGQEKRWRGLFFDLLLGGVPGAVLLLASAVILAAGFGELISEGLRSGALWLLLLGTLGTLTCCSLLTVLVRFGRGVQGSLKPRLAAFLRWGLVAGVILSAAVLLFFFFVLDILQRRTGDDTVVNICLVLLVLAPAVVAAKYIRLLQKVGG